MIFPTIFDIGQSVVWKRVTLDMENLTGRIVGLDKGLVWVEFPGHVKPIGLQSGVLEWAEEE